MARLDCAILKSDRKPLLKILTSFTLMLRHRSVPWVPTYRISRTVSRVNSRCSPMFQLCTYPTFRLGENSFTLLPEMAASGKLGLVGVALAGSGFRKRTLPGGPKSAGVAVGSILRLNVRP